MKCPHCLNKHPRVIATKHVSDDRIERLRECPQCRNTFLTREEIIATSAYKVGKTHFSFRYSTSEFLRKKAA